MTVPLVERSSSLESAAGRLAVLLTGGGTGLADPAGSRLEFDDEVRLQPLVRSPAPPGDVWAVDGGQAVVADARCLQLVVARAARVRFRDGACDVEDEGELRAWLLGGDEDASVAAGLGLGVKPDAAVDLNLLRDVEEWRAIDRCVGEAAPGALVLVDGDLEPDWRVAPWWLAELFGRAAACGVTVAAVTKRSSLSKGGAPLLGALEVEGATTFGARALWWAPVARSRAGARVVVARLDPDARFAFRVDLSPGTDPEPALAGLAALCDDASFPGYPYPLSVADRLAACPPWLRLDTWFEVEELLDRAGVEADVRERAFADRHDLMERF
ncbi:MAG TPA: DNA double-strand break repair nuclease NurA [Acidimicrobiales bacterium]|nr:DNA double-strand break repair nuclease NurA [Acidimicrobiales bacterium]